MRCTNSVCPPSIAPSENEHMSLDERGNPMLRDIGKFLKKKIKQAIPDAGESSYPHWASGGLGCF